MAYRRKWKPSKEKAKAFAIEMDTVKEFCDAHGVSYSSHMDSYYFEVNGQKYRVSNHSVEASNRGAYDWKGNKTRELFHPDGRRKDTRYILASKTRLPEVYNNIVSGHEVDGRGYIKD